MRVLRWLHAGLCSIRKLRAMALSWNEIKDREYRPYPFPNDAKRMEWLFELYERYTAGLFKEEKKSGKTKKAK